MVAYLVIRIQYLIYITYKICFDQLYVIDKASGQQSAVKFWGSQELYVDFQLRGGVPQPQSCSRVNVYVSYVKYVIYKCVCV